MSIQPRHAMLAADLVFAELLLSVMQPCPLDNTNWPSVNEDPCMPRKKNAWAQRTLLSSGHVSKACHESLLGRGRSQSRPRPGSALSGISRT